MIEYSIRESPRARRVRLVMSVRRGLVVVVPTGFDRRGIPAILEGKRAWISRTAAEMERRRRLGEAEGPGVPPDSVCLRAVSEEWRVEYCQGRTPKAGSVRAREAGDRTLRLVGDVSDEEASRKALVRWVSRRAGEVLIPQVRELARRRGFQLGRVSIRQQRTRWGSCSRGNSISLNAKLLFLPPELVEYVLLHELCHTVEPNHSPRYWALVESLDADYQSKRRALRDAGALVPGWLAGD